MNNFEKNTRIMDKIDSKNYANNYFYSNVKSNYKVIDKFQNYFEPILDTQHQINRNYFYEDQNGINQYKNSYESNSYFYNSENKNIANNTDKNFYEDNYDCNLSIHNLFDEFNLDKRILKQNEEMDLVNHLSRNRIQEILIEKFGDCNHKLLDELHVKAISNNWKELDVQKWLLNPTNIEAIKKTNNDVCIEKNTFDNKSESNLTDKIITEQIKQKKEIDNSQINYFNNSFDENYMENRFDDLSKQFKEKLSLYEQATNDFKKSFKLLEEKIEKISIKENKDPLNNDSISLILSEILKQKKVDRNESNEYSTNNSLNNKIDILSLKMENIDKNFKNVLIEENYRKMLVDNQTEILKNHFNNSIKNYNGYPIKNVGYSDNINDEISNIKNNFDKLFEKFNEINETSEKKKNENEIKSLFKDDSNIEFEDNNLIYKSIKEEEVEEDNSADLNLKIDEIEFNGSDAFLNNLDIEENFNDELEKEDKNSILKKSEALNPNKKIDLPIFEIKNNWNTNLENVQNIPCEKKEEKKYEIINNDFNISFSVQSEVSKEKKAIKINNFTENNQSINEVNQKRNKNKINYDKSKPSNQFLKHNDEIIFNEIKKEVVNVNPRKIDQHFDPLYGAKNNIKNDNFDVLDNYGSDSFNERIYKTNVQPLNDFDPLLNNNPNIKLDNFKDNFDFSKNLKNSIVLEKNETMNCVVNQDKLLVSDLLISNNNIDSIETSKIKPLSFDNLEKNDEEVFNELLNTVDIEESSDQHENLSKTTSDEKEKDINLHNEENDVKFLDDIFGINTSDFNSSEFITNNNEIVNETNVVNPNESKSDLQENNVEIIEDFKEEDSNNKTEDSTFVKLDINKNQISDLNVEENSLFFENVIPIEIANNEEVCELENNDDKSILNFQEINFVNPEVMYKNFINIAKLNFDLLEQTENVSEKEYKLNNSNNNNYNQLIDDNLPLENEILVEKNASNSLINKIQDIDEEKIIQNVYERLSNDKESIFLKENNNKIKDLTDKTVEEIEDIIKDLNQLNVIEETINDIKNLKDKFKQIY